MKPSRRPSPERVALADVMFGGGKPHAPDKAAAAESVDASLDDLFSRLRDATSRGAHKKALRISESILSLAPGDPDATRCAVVALSELARHDDAIQCVEDAPADVLGGLTFEWAYSMYRAGRVADALDVLDATEGDADLLEEDRGSASRCAQLRAQLLYRDGRFEESARMYEKMFEVRVIARSTRGGLRSRRPRGSSIDAAIVGRSRPRAAGRSFQTGESGRVRSRVESRSSPRRSIHRSASLLHPRRAPRTLTSSPPTPSPPPPPRRSTPRRWPRSRTSR